MTTRLEPAPPTDEDRHIWRVVCCFYWHERYQTQFCAELQAQRSDRRDADLMYIAQCRRLFSLGSVKRVTAVRVYNIDCGWRLPE